MKDRTKAAALRVIRLSAALPTAGAAAIIGRQLVRCATSVGANYRAACRGRSTAEFVAKLGVAVEEADETLYWLELLAESEIIPHRRITGLMSEFHEILSILVAAVRTTRRRRMRITTRTHSDSES
ncbi:MAG: hypothetical protein FLDDKLPJ_01650 [Phycisphaerae bacterium]|nr:hypothetical protein [Phycisphaerae bacterium]